MNPKTRSLRSPLGRVKGLGAAHGGTHHWWLQRLTAIALIPLALYLVAVFIMRVPHGGYDGAVRWLRDPVAATATVLFLIAGFWHGALGLQVVIEDYVHCEKLKMPAVIGVKLSAAALCALGILAALKILFGA